jgi:cell division protein FtsZ
MGLFEVNEAAEIIADAADTEANVIFGAVIDESLGDQMRVTVIATGFDGLRRHEAEVERPIEQPALSRPPVNLDTVLPQKAHTFEMDEDILDIPRFLRDKD